MIEEELENKKGVTVQSLTMKQDEISCLKKDLEKLKTKNSVLKQDHMKKVKESQLQLKKQEEENEALKIKFSKGEFQVLLKSNEDKSKMIKEIKAENLKLNEIKTNYEKILQNFEKENKKLEKKIKELDEGEKSRELAQNLDVLKMKMMFYENKNEEVDIKNLTEEINHFENKFKEKKSNGRNPNIVTKIDLVEQFNRYNTTFTSKCFSL